MSLILNWDYHGTILQIQKRVVFPQLTQCKRISIVEFQDNNRIKVLIINYCRRCRGSIYLTKKRQKKGIVKHPLVNKEKNSSLNPKRLLLSMTKRLLVRNNWMVLKTLTISLSSWKINNILVSPNTLRVVLWQVRVRLFSFKLLILLNVISLKGINSHQLVVVIISVFLITIN